MNEISDSIIKSINILLNEQLKNIKCDKTFKSTIWAVNPDGTYQISYMNQLYNIHNSLGTNLSPGQSVWVKIPSGIFKNMHICGIVQNKK